MPQRAGIMAAGAVQLALLGAALSDLAQRPSAEVNGSKRVWAAVSFVNFVGRVLRVRAPAVVAPGHPVDCRFADR
jgi:hypothetical protein